jgi:hypothetical protein
LAWSARAQTTCPQSRVGALAENRHLNTGARIRVVIRVVTIAAATPTQHASIDINAKADECETSYRLDVQLARSAVQESQ